LTKQVDDGIGITSF